MVAVLWPVGNAEERWVFGRLVPAPVPDPALGGVAEGSWLPPWVVPVMSWDGVGAGLLGGGLLGSAVGDGDGEGDSDGLDDSVGDGDGDADGEPDVIFGDGDSDGGAVGAALGVAVGVTHGIGELVELCCAVEVGLGPWATEAIALVFAPLGLDAFWAGLAVAVGGHSCLTVEPRVAPGEGFALPTVCALPGRLPLPAGAPPPLPPGWPEVSPPVRTVELTWTMACLNGGTASAMAAMNATPASTPTGRSHAMPSDPRGLGGAAWRGGEVWDGTAGSSRSRGNGR